MFVDYVVIAATAQKEPVVRTAKGGATVLMMYQKVVPMFGAQNLEAVTPIATCHEFNMGDKKPRLIVGTVAYSDAERIFPLDPADGKVFYVEMEQLHRTLSGRQIERVAKKRPADDLVDDTPQKTQQRNFWLMRCSLDFFGCCRAGQNALDESVLDVSAAWQRIEYQLFTAERLGTRVSRMFRPCGSGLYRNDQGLLWVMEKRRCAIVFVVELLTL